MLNYLAIFQAIQFVILNLQLQPLGLKNDYHNLEFYSKQPITAKIHFANKLDHQKFYES